MTMTRYVVPACVEKDSSMSEPWMMVMMVVMIHNMQCLQVSSEWRWMRWWLHGTCLCQVESHDVWIVVSQGFESRLQQTDKKISFVIFTFSLVFALQME